MANLSTDQRRDEALLQESGYDGTCSFDRHSLDSATIQDDAEHQPLIKRKKISSLQVSLAIEQNSAIYNYACMYTERWGNAANDYSMNVGYNYIPSDPCYA